VRVPGTTLSLEKAAAEGADVQPVYSPFQAREAAKANPAREIVFLGIGFETTHPGIGLVICDVQKAGVKNFSVLLSGKRVPPVLDALLVSGKAEIDGFITPGHVTAIIGSKAYDDLCSEYKVPMVVGGFEPIDLLGEILCGIKEPQDCPIFGKTCTPDAPVSSCMVSNEGRVMRPIYSGINS